MRKKWTAEHVVKYTGVYHQTYFGYSKINEIQENAASGGLVTTILLGLLESKEIDGALVVKNLVENGEVVAKFYIAQTRKELIEAQGSKYIPVRFFAEALPLINDFEGKLAVVLLPCDTLSLDKQRNEHPEIDQKIKYVINLFCGHNSDPRLTKMVVDQLLPPGEKIKEFRFRSGHWRGKMSIVCESGHEVVVPFKYFSDYQNLNFFSLAKCLSCYDHFGYHCDISAGDIWVSKMKKEAIKHTALIIRTPQGEKALSHVINHNFAFLKECEITDVYEGQHRGAISHHHVSARAKVGKLFQLKIHDPLHEKVSLLDWMIAFITVFNYRLTTNKKFVAQLGKIPRGFWKPYLYLYKFLEHIHP